MITVSQNKTETNKKRAKLDYVQFDVEFFHKPKHKALKFKFGRDAFYSYIELLCDMGAATDAEVEEDVFFAICEVNKIELEKAKEILNYLIDQEIIFRSANNRVSNTRIVEDQENIARKREEWTLRQERSRDTSVTKMSVTRDTSVTTTRQERDKSVTLNTEDLNTEDLNLEVRKGSGETLKPLRPAWLDKIPIPIAFDEQKTRKALARWVEYCSKKGREFDEIQAETLLYNSINFGANLEKAIFQAVQNGWRSVRFDTLGALEPQEKPNVSLDAVQLVRKKLAGGSNGKL